MFRSNLVLLHSKSSWGSRKESKGRIALGSWWNFRPRRPCLLCYMSNSSRAEQELLVFHTHGNSKYRYTPQNSGRERIFLKEKHPHPIFNLETLGICQNAPFCWANKSSVEEGSMEGVRLELDEGRVLIFYKQEEDLHTVHQSASINPH